MIRLRALLVLGLFGLTAANVSAQDLKAQPVEQVLKDPERYDGQVIRVSGLLHLEFEGTHIVAPQNLKSGRSIDRVSVDLSPFVFRDGFAHSAPVCDCTVIVEGLFHYDRRGLQAVLPRWGWMEKVRIVEGGPAR